MANLKRITMQDVADACGLSRNTVSKIFNNRGSVPDSTKEFVIKKAMELGYLQANAAETAEPTIVRNIALLTHSNPSLHNFGSLFITNFTDQICRFGYNLKVFKISEEDYREKTLPPHFTPDDISGIITIELFDRAYTEMICGLGIPVMLIDSYVQAPHDLINCDLIYMENYASSISLTSRMIAAGAKSIGFVGDINHCCSFHERWSGFCEALHMAGLPVDSSVCILAADSSSYGDVDWMTAELDKLSHIPDGFVCCNDFVAIRLMQALHRKGLSIPEEVMVTGFDGTTEAEVISPSLTTARIPSAEIGRISANMLMERIDNPDLPHQCTHIRTTPVWAESVRQV